MKIAALLEKKQELGIYYTPESVVEFIFDILNILKDKEDQESQRWQSRQPQAHYPSVVDPACGEGIFLKKAVESKFTGKHPTQKVPYVWGIDIDEEVVNKWEEISILDMFEGDRDKMKNHFYHQNGLIPLENKTLSYKKAEDGLSKFDAVVGNPPYGGLGVDISQKEHIQLYQSLQLFMIFNYRFQKKRQLNQDSLLGEAVVGHATVSDKPNLSVKQATSVPIEVLFVERFLQLCKPGGWIAIIVPDGILANSTTEYVRQFIAERAKVLGIVSLPRETFKAVGTTAKTSILFLQKTKDRLFTEPEDLDYPVFLASTKTIEKKYLDTIVEEYRSFIEKGHLRP